MDTVLVIVLRDDDFLPTLFVYIVLKSNLIESKNVGVEEESAWIRIHYIPTLPRRFDFYEETATPLKRLKSFDIFVKEVCKERCHEVGVMRKTRDNVR